jgi:C-terminal region of Mon2 protein
MFALASTNHKPRVSPNNITKPHLTPPPSHPTPDIETPSTTNQITNTTTTEEAPVNSKLTELIVPVLLARCKEVLQRFVVDDRQSGQCPLPRYRLAEVFTKCKRRKILMLLLKVIFLLRELLYLELPSSPPNINNNINSYKSTGTAGNGTNCIISLDDSANNINVRSKHLHLIELYPLFCECITSSEKDLKDLLKEIFYLVGKEFLSVKRL